jgi:hypothetical protein
MELVRFVPQADIAHTPNTIRCRALADAWEQSARRHEGPDLTTRYRPSGDRVQLLIVNWQLPPARLAKRFPKAYIFNTGAPI